MKMRNCRGWKLFIHEIENLSKMSKYNELFRHMSQEHEKVLHDSEMDDVVQIVKRIIKKDDSEPTENVIQNKNVIIDSEFIKSVKNQRKEFVNKVKSQKWNTELRTTAEDLLIIYDQMLHKLDKQQRKPHIAECLECGEEKEVSTNSDSYEICKECIIKHLY